MAKGLAKPRSVASDPYRSAKWDELVEGRDFAPSDAPTLALLVQWHQIVDKCMEDLASAGDGIQVAYSNDMNDIRALPQISTMKQASAEIRQLNKQLGIRDTARAEARRAKSADVLRLAQDRRERRRRDAAG